MSRQSPKRFERLPDRIAADPEFMRWLLSDHEDRIQALESTPPLQIADVQTPIGRLPLPVVILLVSLLIYMRPDLAYRLIGQ
jgi:hypothetical protein